MLIHPLTFPNDFNLVFSERHEKVCIDEKINWNILHFFEGQYAHTNKKGSLFPQSLYAEHWFQPACYPYWGIDGGILLGRCPPARPHDCRRGINPRIVIDQIWSIGNKATITLSTKTAVRETILECQRISKNFGAIVAVKNLNLQLHQSEYLAILGPSGCGKSTILRMIAGFDTIDSGQILLQNKVVSKPEYLLPPQNRALGMVFQDIALFPHLSVSQNITFGLKGSQTAIRQRLRQMLALIGLENLAAKMPHTLSGGEQQRVAIARALAPSPKLILMDEPFSSLDYQLRVHLRQEVRDILHQENVSTILVTHDQDEAFVFADRVIVINQGEVVQVGTPSQIYHHPQNPWVASFVGEANFLAYEFGKAFFSAQVAIDDLTDNSPRQSSQLMVRPEDMRVKPTSPDRADGVIRYIDFSGNQQFLKIKLFPDTFIQVCVSSKESWHAGDHIVIDIDHCLLYPG